MKIIKTAKEKMAETGEWWIDRHVSCPGCGCVFQLEAGDNISPYRIDVSVGVRCPDCKRYVVIPKPVHVP